MITAYRHYLRAVLALSVGTVSIAGASLLAVYSHFHLMKANLSHVGAGTLDVDFRFHGIYGVLVDDGKLKNVDKSEAPDPNLDLTHSKDEIFKIDNAMPGLSASYMYTVKNTGTVDAILTVGFYHLSIDQGTVHKDAGTELSKKLEITFSPEEGKGFDGPSSFFADAITETTEEEKATKFASKVLLPASGQVSFEVNLGLDYESIGNEISGGTVAFDMYVSLNQPNAG